MKKLIAVLLAALMCASILMACGGSGNTDTTAAPSQASQESQQASQEEQTKDAEGHDADWPAETYKAIFILYVPQDGWAGTERVKAYIKELTKKDLNIECEIVPMTFATYNAQIPMMLSAKEQIDVLSVSNALLQYDQGYIVNLMDYLPQIEDALQIIGKEEIMGTVTDGLLLTLPWQLERTHRYGMAMRTDLLEKSGFDPATINDAGVDAAFDKATEIFAKIKEDNPGMVVMGGPQSSLIPNNTQHTHAPGNNYGVLDNYGAELTCVNYYETDYYYMANSYMRKWYEAGYIQQDIAVSSDSYESLVKAGNTFGGCCPMKPDSYAEKRDQCNYDMTIFYFREDLMTAYNTLGTGYTVSGTAKDKVQAARLLNYVFTSRDFEDAINWGEPGVDWVESPDNANTAMYPEGVEVSNAQWHNSYGWAYPNERIAHVWIGNDPEMYTRIYVEAEQKSHRTKAWGFQYSNANVQDAISALDNIVSEYSYQIASGASADYENLIKEFNDKMYKSGLQDVIDDKQKQLDDWAAAKGLK